MTRYGVLIDWRENVDPYELAELEEEFAFKGLNRETPGFYITDHNDVVKIVLDVQRAAMIHPGLFKRSIGIARLFRIADVSDLTRIIK